MAGPLCGKLGASCSSLSVGAVRALVTAQEGEAPLPVDHQPVRSALDSSLIMMDLLQCIWTHIQLKVDWKICHILWHSAWLRQEEILDLHAHNTSSHRTVGYKNSVGSCLTVRVFEEANLGESSSEQLSERPRPPPRLAAESAASFKVELAEMKRILDEQGTKLPADRFDDSNAELLRFAASAGLLQVRMTGQSTFTSWKSTELEPLLPPVRMYQRPFKPYLHNIEFLQNYVEVTGGEHGWHE